MKILRFRYNRSYIDINGVAIPEPLAIITLEGPNTFQRVEASISPSFPYTLFEEDDAKYVGIDLSQGKDCDITLITGDVISARFAIATLRVDDRTETCAWEAPIAFTKTKLLTAVLGHYHCLEYFRMTFDPGNDEFALETNRSYPGS